MVGENGLEARVTSPVPQRQRKSAVQTDWTADFLGVFMAMNGTSPDLNSGSAPAAMTGPGALLVTTVIRGVAAVFMPARRRIMAAVSPEIAAIMIMPGWINDNRRHGTDYPKRRTDHHGWRHHNSRPVHNHGRRHHHRRVHDNRRGIDNHHRRRQQNMQQGANDKGLLPG